MLKWFMRKPKQNNPRDPDCEKVIARQKNKEASERLMAALADHKDGELAAMAFEGLIRKN